MLLLLYVLLLLVRSAADWSDGALTVLRVIDGVFIILLAIEVSLKMAGMSFSGFCEDIWNRIDLAVMLVRHEGRVPR